MTSSSDYINVLRDTFVKFADYKNLKNFCSAYGLDLPPGAFTRDRIFTQKVLLGFILYPKHRSLFIDELSFLGSLGRANASAAAFSRRRTLIPDSYIREFHKSLVSDIYGRGLAPERWNGHALFACDGTTYTMPDTRQMKDYFLQGRKTGHSQQPLARGVVIKDVANDIVIGANMECYGEDETRLAVRLLEDLPEGVSKLSPVVVFDRKYCAYTLIDRLLTLRIDFIVRVKRKFNSRVDRFLESGKKEEIVELRPGKATIKKLRHLYGSTACRYRVRLVRCSDDVAVMTSLLSRDAVSADTVESPEASGSALSEAYALRWTDETSIGFLKNNLEVEIFSSTRPAMMYQDFYCKLVNYNIVTLLAKAAAAERLPRKKRPAHKVGINRNDTLGIVAIMFWKSLVLDNLKEVWTDMLNQIGRNTCPIIPDRHNLRAFRKIKTSGKYVTMTNYKEAV